MKPMLNPGVGFPGGLPNDTFYSSPISSYFRRHTPYFGQPDIRIDEMNKRLQQRTEDSDNLWWGAFATEFFEDDATLTLTFCLEDVPKRYTIGRRLIPRYFQSIFEGEVTDLYFSLKHAKESFHNTTITLDCDQCTMVAHYGKPMYNKVLGGQYPNEIMKEQLAKDNAVVVCTEGRLILEFTFDDLMRIKSWHFATRQHKELVPRSLIALQVTQAQQQDPAMLEQLSKNITRQGLTNSTLNYVRLCAYLEPMQELMSRHKAYALRPRDCLKITLFQKCQRMVALPGGSHRPGSNDFKMQPEVGIIETQRPPSKRGKRRSSATNNANNTGAGSGGENNNMSPGPPNFSLASQGRDYVGNALEHYSDGFVRTALFSLSMAWSLGVYASPLLACFMYQRGYFSSDGVMTLYRLSIIVGLLFFVTMLFRGVGRTINSHYITFIAALDAYKQKKSRNLKVKIRQRT